MASIAKRINIFGLLFRFVNMCHFKIWLSLSVDKLVLVWLFASVKSKYWGRLFEHQIWYLMLSRICCFVFQVFDFYCVSQPSILSAHLVFIGPVGTTVSAANQLLWCHLVSSAHSFLPMLLHLIPSSGFLCSSHDLYIKMRKVTLWFANTGLKPRVWLYSRVSAILSFWFDLSTIM